MLASDQVVVWAAAKGYMEARPVEYPEVITWALDALSSDGYRQVYRSFTKIRRLVGNRSLSREQKDMLVTRLDARLKAVEDAFDHGVAKIGSEPSSTISLASNAVAFFLNEEDEVRRYRAILEYHVTWCETRLDKLESKESMSLAGRMIVHRLRPRLQQILDKR